MKNKASEIWLLMGLTGSTNGTLAIHDEWISFHTPTRGALTGGQLRSLAKRIGNPELADQLDQEQPIEIFRCPVSEIEKVHFPWYTLGGGMNLTIRGNRYRFSFLQPQNTRSPTSGGAFAGVLSISRGRKLGKEWRSLLKG